MKKINEVVKGNVKIIEIEHYVNGFNGVFKTFICKKLTKNGIWREFRRFNANNIEEAFQHIKD